MNKQIDMSAFIGQDFDCEFTDDLTEEAIWQPAPLKSINQVVYDERASDIFYRSRTGDEAHYCRPRLNKPQVLDDWSWVPDGLVLELYVSNYKHGGTPYKLTHHSRAIKQAFLRNDNYEIVWASCIGVEPDYKEWGEAHGLPVVEV